MIVKKSNKLNTCGKLEKNIKIKGADGFIIGLANKIKSILARFEFNLFHLPQH